MVTGRMDIGLSTLVGSEEFEEIVRLSYPSKHPHVVMIVVPYNHDLISRKKSVGMSNVIL